jgi:hypothetical protein
MLHNCNEHCDLATVNDRVERERMDKFFFLCLVLSSELEWTVLMTLNYDVCV